MKPYFCAGGVTLYLGDCIEVMRALPDASVDAVVCDPPYGLEFMGKEWDAPWKQAGDVVDDPADVGGFQDGNGGNPYSRSRIRYGVGIGFQQWCEAWAREAYRVLKPGAHLLAFGGTRTHHRLVCGIEDAGFEIRDELDWMFGSGFPKSLDVSKAIDKLAGAEREVIGQRTDGRYAYGFSDAAKKALGHVVADADESGFSGNMGTVTAPATEDAQRWQGWGTALKPAHEPICLARKPLAGNVAANVLRHGTGAINIDGTRVGNPEDKRAAGSRSYQRAEPGGRGQAEYQLAPHDGLGRWPANVLLDEAAAALLDATVGERVSGAAMRGDEDSRAGYSGGWGRVPGEIYGDRGGPSRFFYTAKASRSEREAGLEDLPGLTPGELTDRKDGAAGTNHPRAGAGRGQSYGSIQDGRPHTPEGYVYGRPARRNDHPTVKPIDLMRWLVRLITPPGGVVLDPFLGSGTTALAALDERFKFIGIDMTERYVEIARYRVTHRHVLETKTREADEAIPQGRLL